MRASQLLLVGFVLHRGADALHHRFSSVGCAYCLTCFFNNIVAAEQEPVSPCGFALQQWAKERMTRYKQSTVQEQRYMEMPRDWEEKINREMVNVGILR
ncbi:nipblb [Symbiodinium necroappetens]|uniref:Nipblb protein n=1 Tax=Symbiodinium necroappetens TaxID=1628268 RepID=A0A812YQB5_9DINO|nr:nipblb [Symbiodinium necroappetens]